jgi:hypothetical protein
MVSKIHFIHTDLHLQYNHQVQVVQLLKMTMLDWFLRDQNLLLHGAGQQQVIMGGYLHLDGNNLEIAVP